MNGRGRLRVRCWLRPVAGETGLGLLHALGRGDDLNCAGPGVRLYAAALGPGVGGVVVVDIGDQQAGARLVQDQPDVAPDARGPEVRIFRLVDPVHLQSRCGRIELQVHYRQLDGLLLLRRQAGEGGGEGVGDAKVHQRFTERSVPGFTNIHGNTISLGI